MNCEIAKTHFMDLLYEEIEPETARDLKEHLNGCARCQKEFAALQKTRAVLQQLPQEEPPTQLVFSAPAQSALRAWLQQAAGLLPRPLWARASLAAAGLALLLLVAGSLANLHIRYGDGQFELSMHLLQPRTDRLPPEVIQALMAQMRSETGELVAQMLAEERLQQEQKIDHALSAFAQDLMDLRRQRENDLMLIGQGLEQIQRTTSYQFGETSQFLRHLARQINYSK